MTLPLNYANSSTTPPDRTYTHEIIYCVLLGAFGGLMLFGGGMVVTIFMLDQQNSGSRLLIAILASVYGFYGFGSFAVMLWRILKPGQLRWITVVWNIVLLPFISFGTAIGIYGFIVLDRKPAAIAQ